MVDKNVFTQELSKVFTILQEVRLVEKYIKDLIDSNNLTEDKVVEFEEKLNQYKRDLDYINENSEQLQESLNQTDINVQELTQYIDSIKDYINQNNTTTEIGGNLEVDGNITINSVDNLITKDGSSFGGGGSGLYLHELTIDISQASNGGTYGFITLNIITNKETEMTTNDIWNYLRKNGFTSLNTSKQCTGAVRNNTNLFSLSISSIYDENDYNYVKLAGLRLNRSKITINETEHTLTTDSYSDSINVYRSSCTIKKQLITKL